MKCHLTLLSATLALGASGCVIEGFEYIDSTTQAIDECPSWVCNTAYIEGFDAAELNTNGLVSPSGFRVVDIELVDGHQYALRVQNGDFHAVDDQSAVVATGSALVGATIHIVRQDGSQTYPYDLYIMDYRDDLTYWGSVPGTMPAYRITYGWNGFSEDHICKPPVEEEPGWAGFSTYAVLIQGERYDSTTKTIYDDSDGGWFQIACTGSGLSKMKRLGYDPETPAGSNHATTRDQRQATIKMITADYCGTGHSFTRDGTPLRWQNAGDWHIPADAGDQEAIWSPHGALCLDTTRLSPLNYPHLLDDIMAECGGTLPPPCAWVGNGGWPAGAEWHTFLPL